jgi:hypothetical protein
MTVSASRRVPTLVAAAAFLLVVFLSGPGWQAAGAAPEAGAYDAVARADAFRVGVTTTEFLVADIVDASGPTAQAEVDSLGKSVGFAALPYPGDTATTAPGLVASVVLPQVGLPPPTLPRYPLATSSQYPGQPTASVNQPPVGLNAQSSASSSTAHSAASGAASGGNTVAKAAADATSKVDDAGKIIADASATLESVTIAGVLRIGAVTATANVTRAVDGALVAGSSFNADGMTVAGVPVDLTDHGLVLAGSTVPIPPSSSVAQALKAAGIQMGYLAPTTSPGSVRSAGLMVSAAQQAPTGNKFVVTYTFGVADASVSSNVSGGPASSTDAGAAGDNVPASSPIALSPAPHGALGATPVAVAPSGPSSSGGLRQTVAPPTDLQTARRSVAPVSTVSALSIYVVLVVGATVALSSSLLLRYFAIRLAWTS